MHCGGLMRIGVMCTTFQLMDGRLYYNDDVVSSVS